MTTATRALLTGTALLALTGCSAYQDAVREAQAEQRDAMEASPSAAGDDVVTLNEREYVQHVRTWIPSANAYGRETLLQIADNVCAIGNVDDGVRILDNYESLDPAEYDALAISALTYACP